MSIETKEITILVSDYDARNLWEAMEASIEYKDHEALAKDICWSHCSEEWHAEREHLQHYAFEKAYWFMRGISEEVMEAMVKAKEDKS